MKEQEEIDASLFNYRLEYSQTQHSFHYEIVSKNNEGTFGWQTIAEREPLYKLNIFCNAVESICNKMSAQEVKNIWKIYEFIFEQLTASTTYKNKILEIELGERFNAIKEMQAWIKNESSKLAQNNFIRNDRNYRA